MDSEYLMQSLGKCLVEALAEVVERRPMDPIEFLAQYIKKYQENLEFSKKKAAYQKQVEEFLKEAREEADHRKRLKEEEERIQAAQAELDSTLPPAEPSADPLKMEVMMEVDGQEATTPPQAEEPEVHDEVPAEDPTEAPGDEENSDGTKAPDVEAPVSENTDEAERTVPEESASETQPAKSRSEEEDEENL